MKDGNHRSEAHWVPRVSQARSRSSRAGRPSAEPILAPDTCSWSHSDCLRFVPAPSRSLSPKLPFRSTPELQKLNTESHLETVSRDQDPATGRHTAGVFTNTPPVTRVSQAHRHGDNPALCHPTSPEAHGGQGLCGPQDQQARQPQAGAFQPLNCTDMLTPASCICPLAHPTFLVNLSKTPFFFFYNSHSHPIHFLFVLRQSHVAQAGPQLAL